MRSLFQTIRDIKTDQETLRRRPYGMIETANGRFVQIQLKPWPKVASLLEARWIQAMKSRRRQQDVCRVYYNQPFGHRNFLTLSYIESSQNTSVRTFFAALNVLNQIAFIKRSDALLAEVSNKRITDRFMIRRGWERHLEQERRRHWIKRFYGEYPEFAKSFLNEGERAETPVPI